MCGLLFGILAVVSNPEDVDGRIAPFFMVASTAFTLSALGLSIGYVLNTS